MAHKLVVALDFSEVGRAALDAAIALAKDLKASLVLVHAFGRGSMGPDLTPAGVAKADDSEALLDEGDAIELSTEWAGLARAAGLGVVTEAAEGAVTTVILEAARRHEALLIVVGTHGHTGLKRLVLGSVAELVVRHSDRPVLVVPHKAP